MLTYEQFVHEMKNSCYNLLNLTCFSNGDTAYLRDGEGNLMDSGRSEKYTECVKLHLA